MYLGEKSGKFYREENKYLINQWLMGQMAYVGPMLGQHHQFHHYNSGKSEWGEKRYFKIATSIYKDLDDRLSNSEYLAEIIQLLILQPFLGLQDTNGMISDLKNLRILPDGIQ